MTTLFITGLSGVGKSSTLREMETRGYHTVDLDFDYMKIVNGERLIDEMKLQNLIDFHDNDKLIIAGTESNQGKFYDQFEAVILLTADLEVMLDRIEKRTNNPYGKSAEEKADIIQNHKHILPLLKKNATQIIDTGNKSVQEICDQLENNYFN